MGGNITWSGWCWEPEVARGLLGWIFAMVVVDFESRMLVNEGKDLIMSRGQSRIVPITYKFT